MVFNSEERKEAEQQFDRAQKRWIEIAEWARDSGVMEVSGSQEIAELGSFLLARYLMKNPLLLSYHKDLVMVFKASFCLGVSYARKTELPKLG